MSGIEEILIERTSEINKLRVDLLNSNKIIEHLEKEKAELQETHNKTLIALNKAYNEIAGYVHLTEGLTPEMIRRIKKLKETKCLCHICDFDKMIQTPKCTKCDCENFEFFNDSEGGNEK